MPYKSDKKALKDPFLDKRTKLLPCQREMVHYWYDQGMSIRGIARLFKVNRRLIHFELFPERKAKNLQDREARGGSMAYYKKEYHTEQIREHRNRKEKIDKDFNRRL